MILGVFLADLNFVFERRNLETKNEDSMGMLYYELCDFSHVQPK